MSVRKGRLAPTAVARRFRDQPLALWRHIVSRLPMGRDDFDREAGWLSLAVVGSGAPVEEWINEIHALLLDLGWRDQGSSYPDHFPVNNPTLDTLQLLAGDTRHSRLTGPAPAVSATARAVIGLGNSEGPVPGA